jgi:hypothetical protein
MNIGDKIELRNCFSNEAGEYELVDIDEYRNHRFKKGSNIHIITEQALKYLGLNNKEGKNMNFIEAVKLLELDENIKLMRRSKDLTIFTGYGILQGISKQGHTGFKLFLKDILAEDWYVVKNEKLHTFEEAIVAFKNGNTIKRKATQIHYNTDRWPPEMALLSTQDLIANDWLIIEDK